MKEKKGWVGSSRNFFRVGRVRRTTEFFFGPKKICSLCKKFMTFWRRALSFSKFFGLAGSRRGSRFLQNSFFKKSLMFEYRTHFHNKSKTISPLYLVNFQIRFSEFTNEPRLSYDLMKKYIIYLMKKYVIIL